VRALLAAIQCHKGGACFGVAERAPDGTPHIAQVFAAAVKGMARRVGAGVQLKRHLGEGEEAFTPATEPLVFDHAGARFGVAICGEPGFDGPFDAAAAGGARLVLFPAAPGLHSRRTGEASWQQGFDCGRARPWATRAATRAAGACGSPWQARPAPRSMKTSPGWRR
jgi:predicted amidohydrolase